MAVPRLALALLVLAATSTGDNRHNYWPDKAEELQSRFNITVLSSDPILWQIDEFLTDAECDHIISLGRPLLARSTAGLEREVMSVRTSSTAWLTAEHIVSDPVLIAIEDRIADITNTDVRNQEHFQVLNYAPDQYYMAHNDYIAEQAAMPCGPRLATFFLYLNDVEDGGATHFHRLGLKVQPKKGRAALWYNIHIDTKEMDGRLLHEATPVLLGEKWAANKWIHTDNFVDNWRKGLTG